MHATGSIEISPGDVNTKRRTIPAGVALLQVYVRVPPGVSIFPQGGEGGGGVEGGRGDRCVLVTPHDSDWPVLTHPSVRWGGGERRRGEGGAGVYS